MSLHTDYMRNIDTEIKNFEIDTIKIRTDLTDPYVVIGSDRFSSVPQ